MARNKVSPARWAAFDILQKVEEGLFSSVLLADDHLPLEPNDRALCHELVLGVLRWQLNLDRVIEHYSNRKVETLDRAVRISLRLGLYQLRFLTRIPPSAAVDESVKLVQAVRLSSARAFVNAVLRRATREPGYDPASGISDPIERLAVMTSHPSWLVERWVNSFGLPETESFARANNQTPPVAFRVVSSKANERDVLSMLNEAGVAVDSSSIAEGAWRTAKGSPVLRGLAGTGEIYLQDEASQLVAEVVAARAGQRVLDLCSAPGGKTALVADRSEALVIACDISSRRLRTVTKKVDLQKTKRVSPVLLDAAQTLPFQPGSFDCVLVDAPCSGTGTLRHNPEIRWRITADDIKRLALQQGQFLRNAAEAVNTGGYLVYSTCSVERDENEEVVAEFLEKVDQDFKQVEVKPGTRSDTLRTWPHRDGCDGFFVAVFKKF